jgi:hypothetical protein
MYLYYHKRLDNDKKDITFIRKYRKDDIMNNIMVSDNIKIENMIYEIRGKQVMLDSDLAKLYGVETKKNK